MGPEKELHVGHKELDFPVDAPCGSSRKLDTGIRFYGKITPDSMMMFCHSTKSGIPKYLRAKQHILRRNNAQTVRCCPS